MFFMSKTINKNPCLQASVVQLLLTYGPLFQKRDNVWTTSSKRSQDSDGFSQVSAYVLPLNRFFNRFRIIGDCGVALQTKKCLHLSPNIKLPKFSQIAGFCLSSIAFAKLLNQKNIQFSTELPTKRSSRAGSSLTLLQPIDLGLQSYFGYTLWFV